MKTLTLAILGISGFIIFMLSWVPPVPGQEDEPESRIVFTGKRRLALVMRIGGLGLVLLALVTLLRRLL